MTGPNYTPPPTPTHQGGYPPPQPNQAPPPKPKKPIYKRWYAIVTYVIVGLVILVSIVPGEDEPTTAVPDPVPTVVADEPAEPKEPAGKEPKAEPKEPAGKEPKEPQLTVEQEQAIESAQSYIDLTAFSKKGLIDQLEFEGFSKDIAKFAANHVKVDWMAEAVESAESYLEVTSFSKSGLIDQLEFEGFTRKQAVHGATVAFGG